MYMYIACTYMFIHVHTFINMYIHVCTMYRALCTDLQILVHVVRIPDVRALTGSAYAVTRTNFKAQAQASQPLRLRLARVPRLPNFQVRNSILGFKFKLLCPGPTGTVTTP